MLMISSTNRHVISRAKTRPNTKNDTYSDIGQLFRREVALSLLFRKERFVVLLLLGEIVVLDALVDLAKEV